MADGQACFPAPKRRLIVEKNTFSDPKSRYKRHIDDHVFNHALEVLIPECPVQSAIQCAQSPQLDRSCYYLAEIPVVVFTRMDFIEAFIKQGRFCAFTWGTRVDTGNCFAILPNGTLIMSLDKDTYEQLGLTGKPSTFQKKQRFIIEVDLMASFFVPGKKFYERVKWCLMERLNLTFKFLMCWTIEGKSATDSGVCMESYFSSYNCQKLRNVEKIQFLGQQRVPVVRLNSTCLSPDPSQVEPDECCSSADFFEWLGCIACGVDCSSGSSDSFISTLACPEPSHLIREMTRCRWKGLIAPDKVQVLLQALRELMNSSAGEIPWMSLTVWGFADCPVTWNQSEHGYSVGGENLYSFVVLPGDKYWLYTAMGSNDICT